MSSASDPSSDFGTSPASGPGDSLTGDQKGWPEDWPQEKRTGFAFLQELMRRHPDRVQVGTLEEGEKWLDEAQHAQATPDRSSGAAD